MKKLNIGDLPEIALTKLAEECLDWKMQLVDNEENLLGLQYQFFESSLRYLVECQDRMIDDEMRFGKENFQNTTGKFSANINCITQFFSTDLAISSRNFPLEKPIHYQMHFVFTPYLKHIFSKQLMFQLYFMMIFHSCNKSNLLSR